MYLWLGFLFIPEQLELHGAISAMALMGVVVVAYFGFLPALYWQWIIKAGKQKPWKMLLVLSLSCVCARYSFPENLAQYFDFITYIRYPVIAVLLLIEFYLMATLIRSISRINTIYYPKIPAKHFCCQHF